MKNSSVFHMNCRSLVALATVLVIFMPVFCHGKLPGSNSASVGVDEPDVISVSALGRQIDILTYKIENLESSLKQMLQAVIKTNEYMETELFDEENNTSGVIKNIILMIASERQEVEDALYQQREFKVLSGHYDSVLNEKTAILEKKSRQFHFILTLFKRLHTKVKLYVCNPSSVTT